MKTAKKIKKTSSSSETAQIIREQLELVKTEKEIKQMLEKINNQINQLMVSLF